MSSTRIRGVQILDGTLTDAKVASDAAIADEKLLHGTDFLLRDGTRSMTGNLDMGGKQIIGILPGTNPTDAVTLQQVEAHIAGFDFQADVLAVQTDNSLVPTVTLGARYIVTDTSNLDAGFTDVDLIADNNDVIEYNGSAWELAYSVSENGEGALIWDQDSNAFMQWNGTTWQPTGSLVGVTAGSGLTKTAETLSVELGDGMTFAGNAVTLDPDNVTLELSGGQLQVKDDGITAAKLAADVAGDGLVSNAGALDVNVDNSTLEIVGGAVQVKDLGVTTAKLALNSVTKDIINADVAGIGLSQAVGGELDVNVDDSSIEISGDALQVKADGITEAMLNATVAGDGLVKNGVSGKIELNYDDRTFRIFNGALELKLADESLEITANGLRLAPIGDGYTYVGGDTGLPIPVKQTFNENLEDNTANTTAGYTFDSSRTDFLLDLELLSGTEEVFLNGVKLTPTVDYTTSTTDSVTTISFDGLNTPVGGDVILISYQGFEPAA